MTTSVDAVVLCNKYTNGNPCRGRATHIMDNVFSGERVKLCRRHARLARSKTHWPGNTVEPFAQNAGNQGQLPRKGTDE